jgi:hypothetical protein
MRVRWNSWRHQGPRTRSHIVRKKRAHTSSVADQPWHAKAVEISAKATLLRWLFRDGLTRDVRNRWKFKLSHRRYDDHDARLVGFPLATGSLGRVSVLPVRIIEAVSSGRSTEAIGLCDKAPVPLLCRWDVRPFLLNKKSHDVLAAQPSEITACVTANSDCVCSLEVCLYPRRHSSQVRVLRNLSSSPQNCCAAYQHSRGFRVSPCEHDSQRCQTACKTSLCYRLYRSHDTLYDFNEAVVLYSLPFSCACLFVVEEPDVVLPDLFEATYTQA